MAKKKKIEETDESTPALEIMSAALKDDYCNYSYEIRQGIGVGDVHAVKGKGIIDRDLHDAFSKLNVHMACIDDAFKNADEDVTNINDVRSHELTMNYTVTGIKLRGSVEDLSVIIIGEKRIDQVSGRMELVTPKVPLDKLSSYQFYPELFRAVEHLRAEVLLYKNGKYTTEEAAAIDSAQLEIDGGSFEDAQV